MSTGITKAPRVVTWTQPKNPKTMKKAATPDATGDTASVRTILDGGANPTYTVEPLNPSDVPGQCGTVVLVPNGEAYYFALIYIGGEEGSVLVSLPPVQGILVMDLPNGMFTSQTEMNNAIQSGTGTGPPGTVGPT
jgi:hypothetical protein